jgi:WD40 repeat protein
MGSVPTAADLDALEVHLSDLITTSNSMDVLRRYTDNTLSKLFAFENRVNGREHNLGAKFIESLPTVADAPVPSIEPRFNFEGADGMRRMHATTSAVLQIAQSWSGADLLLSSLNCVMLMPAGGLEEERPPVVIKLPGPFAFSRVSAFHPSDRLAGLTKYDTIFLFDIHKGQIVGTLKCHKRVITGILFSSDGSHMVTGGLEGRIITNDLLTSKTVYDIRLSSGISALAANFDGGLVAAALANGHIEIFDAREDQTTLRIEAHSGYISALSFSPDSSLIASGGNDRVVNLFDIRRTLTSYAKFHRHIGSPLTVTFDNEGHVWSGTRIGEIQAWNCTDGSSVLRETVTCRPVYSLLYSEYRNSVFCASAPACVSERPMQSIAFQCKRSIELLGYIGAGQGFI